MTDAEYLLLASFTLVAGAVDFSRLVRDRRGGWCHRAIFCFFYTCAALLCVRLCNICLLLWLLLGFDAWSALCWLAVYTITRQQAQLSRLWLYKEVIYDANYVWGSGKITHIITCKTCFAKNYLRNYAVICHLTRLQITCVITLFKTSKIHVIYGKLRDMFF